jgi:hypothetical protein
MKMICEQKLKSTSLRLQSWLHPHDGKSDRCHAAVRIDHQLHAIYLPVSHPNECGQSASAERDRTIIMDSPTPSFAGLRGQPLVLAVTLTSGLGVLYERVDTVKSTEQFH